MSEIKWWVNKTLAYLPIHRGICRRFVNLRSKKDQKNIEYYKQGKIFRWTNFSSAIMIDEKDEKKENEEPLENL